MVRRRLATSLYAAVLFTVLGAVAAVTGQPFIFPSLGPTAFVLAFDRRVDLDRAYVVVGGHLLGVVAGLLAYTVVGHGVVLTNPPTGLSVEGFRLATSGVVSVALTSWGMIATGTEHPPACATTLIVSLGLLSTTVAAATIVVSVVVLVASHWAFVRLFDRWVARSEA